MKAKLLTALGAVLAVALAVKADQMVMASAATQSGQCVLNGAVVSICSVTVPATCTAPVCGTNSISLFSGASCATVGTTLTVVGVSLSTATANYHCN